jgi:hypothetical protein
VKQDCPRLHLYCLGEPPERVPFVLGSLRPPGVVAHATVPRRDRTISSRVLYPAMLRRIRRAWLVAYTGMSRIDTARWTIDRTQRGIAPSQSGEKAESLERTITDAMEVM